MYDTTLRHLNIEEAAAELGVSRRTIERRIRRGQLQTEIVAGRRMVVAPVVESETQPVAHVVVGIEPTCTPVATPVSQVSHDNPDTMTDTCDTCRANDALVSELRARLTDTEAERDHWRHMSQDLSQNMSELTATLYRLNEQKALAPPPPVEINQHRPWWMFWAPRTRAEA